MVLAGGIVYCDLLSRDGSKWPCLGEVPPPSPPLPPPQQKKKKKKKNEEICLKIWVVSIEEIWGRVVWDGLFIYKGEISVATSKSNFI